MTLTLGFIIYAGVVWIGALCWLLRSLRKDIVKLEIELARCKATHIPKELS